VKGRKGARGGGDRPPPGERGTIHRNTSAHKGGTTALQKQSRGAGTGVQFLKESPGLRCGKEGWDSLTRLSLIRRKIWFRRGRLMRGRKESEKIP